MADLILTKAGVWEVLRTNRVPISWESGPWVSGRSRWIYITGRYRLDDCEAALKAAGIPYHRDADSIELEGDGELPCSHPFAPKE